MCSVYRKPERKRKEKGLMEVEERSERRGRQVENALSRNLKQAVKAKLGLD
jgi:hypothetical protein